MTSVLLVFHLIREHPIGLVLDLGPGKCAKSHILFVPLIRKLVSTLREFVFRREEGLTLWLTLSPRINTKIIANMN